MKLSQEAVDDLLHVICQYDRERGIPHDYIDLERAIQNIEMEVRDNAIYFTAVPKYKV